MKVRENLIKPLVDYYGDPKWDEGDRNSIVIYGHWEDVFKSYAPERLQEAACIYIRSDKRKTFPEIAHLMEILRAFTVTATATKHDCHHGLLNDYKDYCAWINTVLGNFGKETPYPLWMRRDIEVLVEKYEREFCSLNKDLIATYDDRWRTVLALMWREGWIPQIDQALKEKTK